MGSERWAGEIAEFAKRDEHSPPASKPIVFTGSSTIRLWDNLENRWPGYGVINRGFGGARVRDCLHYIEETVYRYSPRQVVMYAGGNDLARGEDPSNVAKELVDFATRVTSKSQARVTMISVLPHLAFWDFVAKIGAANEAARLGLSQLRGAEYVDVFGAMVALKSPPSKEYFTGDAIHLSALGYRFMEACIEPSLLLR